MTDPTLTPELYGSDYLNPQGIAASKAAMAEDPTFYGLDRLPQHMHKTARLYVLHGIQGGGFFTALVENNLMRAFARADDANTAALRDWAMWLHIHAPSGCYGSPERVAAWVQAGGLIGKQEAGNGLV